MTKKTKRFCRSLVVGEQRDKATVKSKLVISSIDKISWSIAVDEVSNWKLVLWKEKRVSKKSFI